MSEKKSMFKNLGMPSLLFGIGMILATPIWADNNSVSYDDAIISASQFNQKMMQENETQDIAMFISSIEQGASQKSVNSLLGMPYNVEHLSDGVRWEYNVSIPTSTDTFMGCQYRVEFDKSDKLRTADWRKSVCDLLYRQYIGGTTPATAQSIETFSLMSDVLFSFNQYQLSDQGLKTLDKFIDQLLERYHNPVVTITGHTDNLGTAKSNERMAFLRAQQVGSRFLMKGLPKQNVLIKGVGDTSPIVLCEGDVNTQDKSLIDCLAPNRRVEIEIYETP